VTSDSSGAAESGERRAPRSDDSVPCIVCREAIKPGAQVCIHCDSAQDWTRHVARWSTFGAAILALLPLWSGASSLRQLAFPRHGAEVHVRPVRCTPDQIDLAVTNSGDRPAILVDFTLEVRSDGTPLKQYALVPKSVDSRLLKPDDTFILGLEPRTEGAPVTVPTVSTKVCEYRARVRIEGFSENPDDVTVTCACPQA
jgi:predicted nucleic acid-binding Zn ribbon protein